MPAPRHHFADRNLLVATAVTGLGFFLLGYGAILVMPKANSAAVIWPATAFAACMILRHARGWRERGLMLAAVFVTDLFNNALGGDRALMVLGYSLINTAELAWCWRSRAAATACATPARARRYCCCCGSASWGRWRAAPRPCWWHGRTTARMSLSAACTGSSPTCWALS